ncbi:hypothetical protein FKW31_02420 [Acetobacter sp. DmW_136]|uniref:hypothetical protein n=1 Tax=Acetobacter sp. DmW_136 TaxID=2591091 RepID=UPI00123BD1C2|nr:hypothetical protein [Acetobacter sp. DmW_136]KAA8388030.1 hypothetical protein FKW31_02420 [Acetobacter sp. DmW_136]
MIEGATRGKGGYNLWRHLRDDKKQNDTTLAGASRGLVQQGITDQIKELTSIGRYASHSKPLYHVHADPAKDWTAQEWEAYWQDYEKEFSLQKQPFSESMSNMAGNTGTGFIPCSFHPVPVFAWTMTMPDVRKLTDWLNFAQGKPSHQVLIIVLSSRL